MNRKYILLILLFLLSFYLKSQVTIGSGHKPNAGALLDLKEKADGTSERGLSMPRVNILYQNISDIPAGTKQTVAQTIEGTPAAEEWDNDLHKGLLVYHIDKCKMEGAGLYVWAGSQWNKLGKNTLFKGINNVSQTYFDIPSGRDARGTSIPAETLTIGWKGVTVPTWTTSVLPEGYIFYGVGFSPSIASGTLGASPHTINIQATALPAGDISATMPWASRQSVMIIKENDCSQETRVIFNQTNFGLEANKSFTKSLLVYDQWTGTLGVAVKSNATWKVNATGSTGTQTTGQGGKTIKDGTTFVDLFRYDNHVPATAGKYNLTHLTFSDDVTPKRYNDVTVSLMDCRVGDAQDYTINQWALQAGFTQAQINAVTQTAPSAIGTVNKIQLHKDQDNNLFLSGDFGTAGRWMLHNVRASKYDTNRTDGSTIISPNTITATFTGATVNDNHKDPHMGYTNDGSSNNAGSTTFYSKNERIGRLYNWAAVVMKKGWNNGPVSFTEGENTANANHAKVQGICPRGWHVPSDKEWTALEQEITTNTSTYSSWMSNIGGTITSGIAADRGTTHGISMKDVCRVAGASTGTELPNGQSNIITSNTRPGMMIMLTGAAGSDPSLSKPNGYGFAGELWTSSGNGFSGAWARSFMQNRNTVERVAHNRAYMFSVRCKKD